MPLKSPRRAQSLIELLIAISLGAFFVISVAAVIAPSLRENTQAANVQVGAALGRELLDSARAWAGRDWHGIAALATGSINTYYLNTASSPFQLVSGTSSTFPNGYAYRRTITIQGSQVSQINGTGLTNFPVLISTVSAPYGDMAVSSTGSGVVQGASGNDIGFYADASGTNILYSEQEYYSSSTGAIIYWVQVPSLAKNVNQQIYMFYGNPNPPDNFPTGVWDANYKGVYHLASLAGGLTKDSKSGANNGTVTGATAAPATTTVTQIDGAANFAAAGSQYISMPINLSGANQVTAEFWLYQPAYITNAYAAGFTNAGNTTLGGFDILPSNGSAQLEIWGTGNVATNDNVYTRPAAGWHHYAFTENLASSTNQLNLYLDGALYSAGLIRNQNGNNTNTLVNSTFYMMTRGDGTKFDTGIEDEVRVSSNIRSADWINTEYKNETNPCCGVGSFVQIGGATTPSGGSSWSETVTLGKVAYSRSFYVLDAYRSSTGTIISGGGTYDPSTKQIVVQYAWPGGSGSMATYLTRGSPNSAFSQTDWSGGPGQGGPATSTNGRFAASANINYASTTGSIVLPIAGSSPALVGSLDATTLDTGIVAGAQLNALLWHGNLPGGTSVGFQFATSSSSGGPWNFAGPDGTINTFYAASPGTPFSLPYGFGRVRYFRYRVTLTSDANQTLTPRVDDINIDWSP